MTPWETSTPTRDLDAAGTKSWKRILCLQLILWPVLLVLAEVAFRGLLALQGHAYSFEETTETLESLLSRSTEFVPGLRADAPATPTLNEFAVRLLHPFTGYVTTGAQKQLEAQRTYHARLDHAERFDILILGGSVAQMFGQFGDKMLRQQLMEDPRFAGRDIHFMKFGEGGYKQPQQAILLAHLLGLGLRPDAVINLDGYNEVALSSKNVSLGSHPAFPAISHWGSLVTSWGNDRRAMDLALELRSSQNRLEDLCRETLSSGRHRSAILGVLVTGRLARISEEIGARTTELTDYLTHGPAAKTLEGPALLDEDSLDDVVVRTWSESSISMQGMCDRRGIYYLHALQPTLHDRDSKPLTPEESRIGDIDMPEWLASVERVYPKLRQEGARLRSQGVNFVDTSRAFARIKTTLYADNCHFIGKGNRILARHIAAGFLENFPVE